MDQEKTYDAVIQVIKEAFKIGLNCASGKEAFIPFMIIEGPKNSIVTLVENNPLENIKIAQKIITELSGKIVAYAYVYDSLLSKNDEKKDAIIVEIGDYKENRQMVLAQFYRPKSFFRKVKEIGKPFILESYPVLKL